MKSIQVISVLIFLLIGSTIVSSAQDKRSISGVVTAFDSYPLRNVDVVALKSGATTKTDSSGMFTLKCKSKDELSISAEGFRSRKIRVGKNNVYRINLLYTDNVGNFNKAVSNGHISEEALKKGILSVQEKNIKDFSRYTTIYNLIAAEVPKVSVNGSSISSRRVGSTGSTQILIVVNNVIVSSVSGISPNMVKSIQFIDDAAGTAVYGINGANGVLKISLRNQ